MVEISIRRLDPELPLPSYAHPGDAGADLCSAVDLTLEPGERALVPTGIAMALPEGYVALVHPRSGLAARHGISIVNAPGTIDAGYRGEVKVCLVNTDPHEPFTVRRGDRIAQLVIQRFETRVVRRGRGPAGVRPRGRGLRFDRWLRRPAAAGRGPGGKDDDVRFGRRSAAEDAEESRASRLDEPAPSAGDRPAGPSTPRRSDLEERECIDLGSLLVTPVGPDGAAAAGRRGERPGDGRGPGRRGGCARAAGVRGVARRRRLGRAASADRRGDGAHGWHRRRAGGHLRHRAGVHGADADPGRRAGAPSPAGSAATRARPGCCARR